MNATAPEARVTIVADLGYDALGCLASRYGLAIDAVPAHAEIPGSYWGNPEAGLIGRTVHARPDTPVHSVLHELSHLVCMSEYRRLALYRDAGGNDLEESAVCYLQILLADHLAGYSADKVCADMDTWGYSFRLGNTRRWFADDADDARHWLLTEGLISPAGEPAFQLRRG